MTGHGAFDRPSEEELRAALLQRTGSLFALARQRFGVDLDATRIRFDLRGTAAGTASLVPPEIRYNLSIARLDPAEFLTATVAHEVAHMVVFGLYGRAARPHGPQWRSICVELGGDGRRCHRHDAEPARQIRRFPYACACRTVYFSSIRINRIRHRHIRYCCRHCRTPFVPLGAAG